MTVGDDCFFAERNLLSFFLPPGKDGDGYEEGFRRSPNKKMAPVPTYTGVRIHSRDSVQSKYLMTVTRCVDFFWAELARGITTDARRFAVSS